MEWRLAMNYCCQHMPMPVPFLRLAFCCRIQIPTFPAENFLGTSLNSFDNRHCPDISGLSIARTNARYLFCCGLNAVTLIICSPIPGFGFGQHTVNCNSLQVIRSYLFTWFFFLLLKANKKAKLPILLTLEPLCHLRYNSETGNSSIPNYKVHAKATTS